MGGRNQRHPEAGTPEETLSRRLGSEHLQTMGWTYQWRDLVGHVLERARRVPIASPLMGWWVRSLRSAKGLAIVLPNCFERFPHITGDKADEEKSSCGLCRR